LSSDDDRAAQGIDAGLLGEHDAARLDGPRAAHGVRRLPVERQSRGRASGMDLHLAGARDRPAVVAGISAVVEPESETPVDDGDRADADWGGEPRIAPGNRDVPRPDGRAGVTDR